jgi:hypothetical protein
VDASPNGYGPAIEGRDWSQNRGSLGRPWRSNCGVVENGRVLGNLKQQLHRERYGFLCRIRRIFSSGDDWPPAPQGLIWNRGLQVFVAAFDRITAWPLGVAFVECQCLTVKSTGRITELSTLSKVWIW